MIRELPDLVTIGYGMNDLNRTESGEPAVAPAEYERNIRAMIRAIRAETDADIVLLTPCVPNPAWVFASGYAPDYADRLRRLAAESGTALADAQSLWLAELDAGKPHRSLLANNVNHPNEYGHAIYERALMQL